MEKQPNFRMCFVYGTDNPIGLHLAFYTDDEGCCVTRFRPKPEHQDFPGQLHRGLISTLLDVLGLLHPDVEFLFCDLAPRCLSLVEDPLLVHLDQPLSGMGNVAIYVLALALQFSLMKPETVS